MRFMMQRADDFHILRRKALPVRLKFREDTSIESPLV